jgi:predicted N-acyltransferase
MNSTVSIHTTLHDISAQQWNSLSDPNNPFLDYAFLIALEDTQCVGRNTGWYPFYIAVWEGERLTASLAVYEKHHSRGDFLYDWNWEHAYADAGVAYYPKGLVCSPFTPATGQKLRHLPTHTADIPLVINALKRLGQERQWQSVHISFLTQDDQPLLTPHEFLPRIQFQYHWHNHHYTQFDDFLSELKSSRRKQIKKERSRVNELGLDIQIKSGDQLTTADREALFEFYIRTHDKRWGTPFLNLAFFTQLVQTMPQNILCVLAYQNGQAVAGTFNFVKGTKLYGRYWGCREEFPNLHFECCYYQLIDYAIAHHITIFEAGAQGEHKFFRGFDPHPTYFAHHFFWDVGQTAIRKYLVEEKTHIESVMRQYQDMSAYKKKVIYTDAP